MYLAEIRPSFGRIFVYCWYWIMKLQGKVMSKEISQENNLFIDQPHQQFLMTGGTGFIGTALVNQLLNAGHSVTLFVRDPKRANQIFQGRCRCILSFDELTPDQIFDVVINLAGEPIAKYPWTAKRKAQLLDSRLGTTQKLMNWLGKTQIKPNAWIQASAIGAYGVRDPAEELTEESPAGKGFMAELCLRWEEAAQAATNYGVRQVILRFGIVFGQGGALPLLVFPYRFGLGSRLGHGRQIMSWIHREDVLSLIARAIVDKEIHGIYNAVAPESISQAQFATMVGKLLKRPVWLRLPATLIRCVAREMAELFVDGQRVVPKRLMDAGFQFRFPTLETALRDLI